MDTSELMGHVKDSPSFHVPNGSAHGKHIEIPQIPVEYGGYNWETKEGIMVSKFMVLELAAAIILLAVFIPIARKIKTGRPPKGRWWNLIESMLLFMRNEVVRPAIGGKKEADRFLPFIWTMFFFVLACNLLGMVPWAGSPTGAWSVTSVLAIMTFLVVILAGMKKFGLVKFWTGQVPHMELPLVMAILIKPMIFVIEILGMFIKHFVLSIRLLANMFAGHLVLAVILGFIVMALESHVAVWSGVMLSSVFGATMLSLLELFVAFLQAYIFAFLSALFIGLAIHQH